MRGQNSCMQKLSLKTKVVTCKKKKKVAVRKTKTVTCKFIDLSLNKSYLL